MTQVIKRQGGSYVVDGNKTKKVEGTKEPKTSAPRDKDGNRLDRPIAKEATRIPKTKGADK
ncbi:MAG: hypothetical protein JKY45_08670 [Emcibacter sp.]|nr:hypothetical protein [Emcibacter sp.]